MITSSNTMALNNHCATALDLDLDLDLDLTSDLKSGLSSTLVRIWSLSPLLSRGGPVWNGELGVICDKIILALRNLSS